MGKNIAVIGGGIVGLATAYKLQLKYPEAKVKLFEKEDKVGQHQSGRNSGVLHCGLYYQPGSLKAKLAVDGIRQMTEFCQTHDIPHDLCGKIVVATDQREARLLDDLGERGLQNGLLGLKFLNKTELQAREPYVASVKALLVPQEGIVDYKEVMKVLSSLILMRGGEILTGCNITDVQTKGKEVVLVSRSGEWKADLLVNCTGLYSDKTYTRYTQSRSPIKIIPFRGEYMMLKPEASRLVNHLIYPVPDPEYPFLGVHFTRMISGAREVGPNAVFAFKREGYKNTDFSLKETFDSITYKGFLNFVTKNFGFAMGELKSSLFADVFVQKAQKLIPDVRTEHFIKGTAGVRAQAMDPAGKLIMDFNIIRKGNQVHVLNAPSPGATASLAIADYVINEYLS